MLEIVFTIYIICFCLQIFYYLFFFSRITFFKANRSSNPSSEPVSVVICAKNEAANLRKNLPLILSQQYPDFEVVVVNDRSEDESLEVLNDLCTQFQNLRVGDIQKENNELNGKKNALDFGIRMAKNDKIILTDADCRPASNLWLRAMADKITDEKSIVLGYSPYLQESQLLNYFIRFETFYSGLQYLSFALAGVPYMGTGRNLGYIRNTFSRNNFTAGHLYSGDDDLVINASATRFNTSITLLPEAFIYSSPKKTWSGWARQKYRHLSTATHYKKRHQLLLGLLHTSHILFYISFIWLIMGGYGLALVFFLFLIRLIFQATVFGGALIKMKEKGLIYYLPLLDVCFVIYMIIFAPAVFFNKNSGWH